jgi:DHA1 family tetracycline resistance protein-like MFS transporter
VILGVVLGIAGFAALGLAPNEPLFWGAVVIIVGANLTFPSLMSLLSKRVGVDEQGQLQGSLAILFGLSQLIGPIFFTDVFAWSIGPGAHLGLPGLSLLMGAGLICVNLVLSIVYAREPDHPTQPPLDKPLEVFHG